MTNLLPPEAKKQLVVEYWTRVICAWVLLWSGGLLVGVLLLWPTYVLLTESVAAYADSVAAATERTAEFQSLRAELQQGTLQAREIVTLAEQPRLSHVIEDIRTTAAVPTITLTSLTLAHDDGVLQPFSITGIAADRQSLAAFRDRLEALPYVAAAELPIENLAQNQDLAFTILVTSTQ